MPGPITQDPPPGAARLCHSGDEVTVRLTTPPGGTAWLRTNALYAAPRHAEIIDAVENGTPRPGQDWLDLPMQREADGVWISTLTLFDPGCYEAKAYWLPDHSTAPQWPAAGGGNLRLKVEPAWTARQCSVYKAFVRMFRP